MTGCSFLAIQREKGVPVNAYDLNMIVTMLYARPRVLTATACVPLCLPGIADDGYLYLTIRCVTPNLIIIFVTLSPDSYPHCLAKANDIALKLEQLGAVSEVTKAVRENYLECDSIVEGNRGVR